MRLFLPNLYSQNFRVYKDKGALSQSGPGEINGRYDYGQRFIILLFFFSFNPSPTSFINLSYYSLYQKNHYLQKKILTTFKKKIPQQMDFKRQVFAMSVSKAPFSFTYWLTNSLFSNCVSYVTCHLSFVRCQHFSGRSGINEACPF